MFMVTPQTVFNPSALQTRAVPRRIFARVSLWPHFNDNGNDGNGVKRRRPTDWYGAVSISPAHTTPVAAPRVRSRG